MNPATSPQRAANQLAKLWRLAKGAEFPVNAAALAVEWSRQVAPSEPIGDIVAQDLRGFEGGLFWLPTRREWVLLYRPNNVCPGRVNFTVAHEFGHFVLHRSSQWVFQCSQEDTLGAVTKQIEREADVFASYLLMPMDDFRVQVASGLVTLDRLGSCAKRYDVSLTAAVLKWLEFTDQPGVLVVARDGMVKWWRASETARSAAWASLRVGMELPAGSLAAEPAQGLSDGEWKDGVPQPSGVWLRDAAVRETVVTSDRYDMTIALITFSKTPIEHVDEPVEDLTTQVPKW